MICFYKEKIRTIKFLRRPPEKPLFVVMEISF